MKNKLFLSLLAAFGLAGAAQAQTNTTTFVDISTLGAGIVDKFEGGGNSNGTEARVIKVDQRWTRDKVYLITQNTIIDTGVTLVIEPGTLVRFEKNVRAGAGATEPADPGALVVARGGRLIANGTAEAPIIFTSIDDPNVPGNIWTIPPYENRAENGHATYGGAYRVLRTGYTVVRGTDGVGEYTITNTGTPSGVRSYATAETHSGMWDQTGLWGGIVWLGRANITGPGYASAENARTTIAAGTGSSSGKGLYGAEGMAAFSTYAVGGGDIDSDDQGVVSFLSNRYGGFEIQTDRELNAFSMYGVGYNTVIEFVEDWCNKDDAFEFWGGCNTVKYAVTTFCGDDGVDTDAGWVGNIQFVLQIHNPADGAAGTVVGGRLDIDSGDNLSENDGPEGTAAFPKTVATLANGTYIGRGYGNRGRLNLDRVGPEVKSSGQLKLINNVYMDAPFGAISLSGVASEYITRTNGTGYDGSGTTIIGGSNSSSIDSFAGTNPYGEIKGNVWYRCGLAFGSTGARTNIVSISNLVVGSSYTITTGGTNPSAWRTVGAAATNLNTYFTATNSSANNNGTATLIEDEIISLNSISAGNKIALKNQMFRTSTARSSSGATDAQLVSIFGSSVTNPSTSGSTALANSNHVNLNPGFSVPLSGRIAQGSLAFTPTNSTVKNGGWTIDRSRAPQLADLTPTTHIGAVRDNAWYLTWTMLGRSGLIDLNKDVSIEPRVTVTRNGANARVSFTSLTGVKYSVERSTDNKKFESIAVVDGNNGTYNYDDSAVAGQINSTPKFYRVLAL